VAERQRVHIVRSVTGIWSDRGIGQRSLEERRQQEEDLPYVLSPITPPAPTRDSATGRLLMVYLDACAGGDTSGELALLEVLLAVGDEDFSGEGWTGRHREIRTAMLAGRLGRPEQHVAAAVHSELARQAAHAAGLLSDVEHWLWRAGIELSDDGRELLRLPAERALDELVGWEDVEGWHSGLARLEPQEQHAFRLSLELRGEQDDRGLWSWAPLQPWEIAEQMSRRRGDVRERLPVETVIRYLAKARAKIRRHLLPGPSDLRSELIP
jgi:hypothetical protein